MKVTVRYKGMLAVLAGCEEETVVLGSGSTVRALIQALAAKHGDAFRQSVSPGGSRPLMALATINGEAAKLDDVLAEQATVMLVKAMGGG